MTRAAVILVGATLLAGCAFTNPGACTAIGYIYEADLQTSGDFATLEVCSGDECVVAGVEPAPDATDGSLPMLYVNAGRDGHWAVGSIAGTLDSVTVRAYDTAGALLKEQDYGLEWTRTGGSEECGGPAETPPLSFDL